MSTEKDGTEVPPPDALEDSDVTNVKGLPSFTSSDEDDEDVVTGVKPLDEVRTQDKEPPSARRDGPPRLPGVPASVAELQPDSGPHAVASADPAAEAAGESEEEIETVDD